MIIDRVTTASASPGRTRAFDCREYARFYARHNAARRAPCVMFVGLPFGFFPSLGRVALNAWVCYKASIALRNARKAFSLLWMEWLMCGGVARENV